MLIKDYVWYLESEESEEKIYQSVAFNKIDVRCIIIGHLKRNPKDTLYWYKINTNEKFVGDDLIATYSMNPKNNHPSKEIYKGNKLFYKSIL